MNAVTLLVALSLAVPTLALAQESPGSTGAEGSGPDIPSATTTTPPPTEAPRAPKAASRPQPAYPTHSETGSERQKEGRNWRNNCASIQDAVERNRCDMRK